MKRTLFVLPFIAFLSGVTLIGCSKRPKSKVAVPQEGPPPQELIAPPREAGSAQEEIDRLKGVIEQQRAADRTILDIQAVLDKGDAAEAARLAVSALRQYGGTDYAGRLADLKRQAEALLAVETNDKAARLQRLRKEAADARADNNLRAAVISFDQVLQLGDDPEFRRQYDETRSALAVYDENRRRAAELRRDPANLEEAVTLLEAAAKAWPTLQVRQEIDECGLALKNRRDRLGVADFEVRGDVGMPLAGRTVADELLPAFKPKFDLVERGQLTQVVNDLKLQVNELIDNDASRKEVERLARVRYLVVGSISRLSGITVHARMIDVRTGLIVQTAKTTAATPEELSANLPKLAQMLMMNDEEKAAFEEKLAQQAVAVEVAKPLAALPPPPPAPAPNLPAPPPLLPQNARPPELGGLGAEAFLALPQPPPPGQPPVELLIEAAREELIKQRLLGISIELGDNLFLRGRFREAFARYELAFLLSRGDPAVALRLDSCRPFLPPPFVPVVVVPPPPRIAVLNFLVVGQPVVVPPWLSFWTPEGLAPYLSPPYEIVDRGELFWYMGRLGITMRDVLLDPASRRWLGRAMNVRYFVFGTIRETASFEVATHLIDTEYGFEYGSGRIRVHNVPELKLRLGELARETLMNPVERERYRREAERARALIVQAQGHAEKKDFTVALNLYGNALKISPNSIELRVLFDRASRHAREEERLREEQRQREQAATQLQRQRELAVQTEAARLRAEKQPAVSQEHLRERAAAQLKLQARAAQQRDVELSVQLLQSAARLNPKDRVVQEVARADRQAIEQERHQAAERLRAQEITLARAKLDEERRRREAEEQLRLKAQETRDQAEYTRLLDDGQRLFAKGQYDTAVARYQAARQLRKTDEVERLIAQTLTAQARADAQKKNGLAEFDRRQAEEKSRREQADATAQQKRDAYALALRTAQTDIVAKRYDEAIANFKKASELFRTDEALGGLRRAQELRDKEKAKTDVAKKAPPSVTPTTPSTPSDAPSTDAQDHQKRQDDFQKLLSSGNDALAAGRYDDAMKAFTDAGRLMPNDRAIPDLLRQARDRRAAAENLRIQQQQQATAAETARLKQRADYERSIKAGQDALKAKRYDEAAKAFTEAGRIQPGDPQAATLRAQAEKALGDARAAQEADVRRKQDEQAKQQNFTRFMNQGQAAMTARRYGDAVKAYTEATKLMPADATAANALRAATQAQSAAQAPLPPPPPPAGNAAAYNKQMQQGQQLEQQQKFAEAVKAYQEALRLTPGDTRATNALHSAEYSLHMEAGRKAAREKRYADAAKEYEDALRAKPGDRTATDALQRAKQGKP